MDDIRNLTDGNQTLFLLESVRIGNIRAFSVSVACASYCILRKWKLEQTEFYETHEDLPYRTS